MIENLYDRVVELLGKSPADFPFVLGQLKLDLGEEPQIRFPSSESYCFYDFLQSGFSLDYSNRQQMFTAVTLFLSFPSSPNDEHGCYQPYSGSLPFGIKRSDSKEAIESRLPGATWSVKDYRKDRDLRPLVLQCHFDSSGQTMTMISIDYLHD